MMQPAVRLLSLTLPVHDEDYEDRLPLNDGRDLIEFAGRWDYGEKSISKMGDTGIIKRWLDSGEESMVEMVDATFLITCSRVVSHELVRHRIASYQQESQRFVSYEDEALGNLVYIPDEVVRVDRSPNDAEDIYVGAMRVAFEAYKGLRAAGVPKQIARYVLPNATRTRIVAKMGLREWRHVLKLRMHKSAQPEMQEIARLVHGKLGRIYGPDLFPVNIAEERASR